MVLLLWFATLTLTAAQTAPAPAPPVARPAFVTIRTVDPEPLEGILSGFSIRDGAVLRIGSERLRVATERIISMELSRDTRDTERKGRSSSPGAAPLPVWTLTNGDLLRGAVASGGEETVSIDVAGIGEIHVPLDKLRRWFSPAAQGDGLRDALEWFEREPLTEDDSILLTNGDVIRGLLRSIDREGLVMESESGPAKAQFRLVAAARFANPPSLDVRELSAKLSLRDGIIVSTSDFDLSDGQATARLMDGKRHTFPIEAINRFEVQGGQWEWLSAHAVSSYQHTPMLGLGIEYELDRNVLGEPIRVGGVAQTRGIGVHSKSRLRYDLKSKYAAFVVHFGLDDSAGRYADVDVEIFVDGHKRFEHKGLRMGTLVGPIRLDLTNATRLELLVDYGQNGDVQDRFNWVDAGLVRAP